MLKINHFYFILIIVFLSFIHFTHPIPQPIEYLYFADQSKIFNIDHFGDVFSNFLFIIIAVWAILNIGKFRTTYPDEKTVLSIIIFGLFLTGIGSAIFHSMPTLDSLLLDRLPMTIMFFGIFFDLLFSFKILKTNNQLKHFLFAICLASTSLLYWKLSMFSQEDLRPYVFIQFLPIIVLVLISIKYYKTRNFSLIISMILIYILAKICEHFDFQILNFVHIFSGHNLKHILAAIAIIPYFIFKLKK